MPGNTLTDLAALHPSEAWEQALRASYLPPEELQREMNWSIHVLRRFLSTERFYPTYEDIPKFCRLAGNELVIDWLTAKTRQCLPDGLKPPSPVLGCFELMERVATIFSASGDVAQKVREAVADRRLTLEELKSVIKVQRLSTGSNLKLLNELESLAHEMNQGRKPARERSDA